MSRMYKENIKPISLMDFIDKIYQWEYKQNTDNRQYSFEDSQETPSFTVYPTNTYYDFADPDRQGDIFDFVELVEGIESFTEKVEYITEQFNSIDIKINKPEKKIIKKEINQEVISFYDKVFNETTIKYNYLTNERMIPETLLKEHKIIELKNFDCFNKILKVNYYQYYSVALPVIKNNKIVFITLRNTTGNKKYKYNNLGKPDIFNNVLLSQKLNKPIFITEGIIDSLSILSTGNNSIALNSKSNINLLKEYPTNDNQFILMMDKTVDNKTLCKKIKEDIPGINIFPFNWEGIQEDDANEILQHQGIEKMKKIIEKGNNEREETINLLKNPIETNDFLIDESKQSSQLDILQDDINQEISNKIYTGMKNIDDLLKGFPTGLHTLLSFTGIGKTTLYLNWMDNISIKKPVLFFSFEMSVNEVNSKLLSKDFYINKESDISYQSILDNDLFPDMKNTLKEMIETRKEEDRDLYTFKCKLKTTCETIKKTIENYIERYKTKPVIFIDFLQLIADKDNKTDKQRIDDNLQKLKDMSDELNICIFLISSLNRASYDNLITLSSAKESGNIEYLSSTIMTLEPMLIYNFLIKGKNQATGKRAAIQLLWNDYEELNKKEIYFNIIKRRNGKLFSQIPLDFMPASSYYGDGNPREKVIDIESKKIIDADKEIDKIINESEGIKLSGDDYV